MQIRRAAAVALLGLFGAVGAACGGSDTPATESSSGPGLDGSAPSVPQAADDTPRQAPVAAEPAGFGTPLQLTTFIATVHGLTVTEAEDLDDGLVRATVDVEVENFGDTAVQAWLAVTIGVVDAAGQTHVDWMCDADLGPDALSRRPRLDPGERTRGLLCLDAPAAALADGPLFIEASVPDPTVERSWVWFGTDDNADDDTDGNSPDGTSDTDGDTEEQDEQA